MPSDLPSAASASLPAKMSLHWATWLLVGIELTIVLPVEFLRLKAGGWAGWLAAINLETTIPLFVLLLFPLAFKFRKRRLRESSATQTFFEVWLGRVTKPHTGTSRKDITRATVLAGLVAAVSWTASAIIGAMPVTVSTPFGQHIQPLADLPPALHDEYSYLFQAKTFLHSRVSFPSHPDVPGLFDQMHVLNDRGKYAGRYFPGTALWLAPFEAIGHPHWGHWLAGALSSACVFFIGREIAGNFTGLLAGLLTAISPGILTFGQLLLAHHPTLLGLTFFAWMFLRMMRTHSPWNACLAGSGLIFAALCRPMTAVGIGLPFGIWLLWFWIAGNPAVWQRTRLILWMALPILIGLSGMLVYNSRITGEMLTSPYQLYTDIYTPRHAYGFNNAEQAESNPSPKVLENYDKWAENLTPQLAAKNVKDRIIATGQWVLGLLPLAMSLGVVPFLIRANPSPPGLSDSRWWLVLLAVVSLHVAHIPYWFAGIRNWHYVFEAAPFLLLIYAGVTAGLLGHWRQLGYLGLSLWWVCFPVLALMQAYQPWPLEDNPPRVKLALGEDIMVRRNYAAVNLWLDRLIQDRPALVLIAGNPSDRHIDYVTNEPALTAPIIRGRFRPEDVPLQQVFKAFPERSLYALVFDPAMRERIEAGEFADTAFEYLGQEATVSGNATVYRLSPRMEETEDSQ